MNLSHFSALLIDAPVGRHFAQLHRDSQALVESVVQFLKTGLQRGNGVVVIASRTNTDLFMKGLSLGDLDPETFLRSRQLTLLDAEAVLNQCMSDKMPEWRDFRRTIGSALESVQAFGWSTTRAYSEMVNILWRQNHAQAAIRLEEYWNELARLYPFSLFCGYMLDSPEAESYAGPLHEIGRTHTDLMATEEEERFRETLDAASKDIFGIPLSRMLALSGHEEHAGEHRLPCGRRSMLWIMENMPASSAEVLERARRHYQDSHPLP